MWNFSGWDSLSTFAGEVRRPKRTYPLGIALVCVASALNYALPVVVGVALFPDTSAWDSDVSKNTGTGGGGGQDVNLVDVGAKLGRWMGVWVVLAGVVSALGQLNVVMSTPVERSPNSPEHCIRCMSQRRPGFSLSHCFA